MHTKAKSKTKPKTPVRTAQMSVPMIGDNCSMQNSTVLIIFLLILQTMITTQTMWERWHGNAYMWGRGLLGLSGMSVLCMERLAPVVDVLAGRSADWLHRVPLSFFIDRSRTRSWTESREMWCTTPVTTNVQINANTSSQSVRRETNQTLNLFFSFWWMRHLLVLKPLPVLRSCQFKTNALFP